MSNDLKRTLHAAVLRLLRPLVKLLLHHSVPFETFADLARWVYVDVAEKEFALEKKKQTTSRISVITGLNRKEVARLQAMDVADNTEAIASFNRAEIVLAEWVREYPSTDGLLPAGRLPLEGDHSFTTLVKRYSGDMPVRAVLDELLRVGAVRKLDTGEIELVTKSTIVPSAENSKALLTLFGHDTADFISTISNNVVEPNEKKLLQMKTWYDNVPIESLAQTKAIASQKGQEIIDDFISEFSKFDRDITPSVVGSGRARVVFGVYYHQEITDEGLSAEVKPLKARK